MTKTNEKPMKMLWLALLLALMALSLPATHLDENSFLQAMGFADLGAHYLDANGSAIDYGTFQAAIEAGESFDAVQSLPQRTVTMVLLGLDEFPSADALDAASTPRFANRQQDLVFNSFSHN